MTNGTSTTISRDHDGTVLYCIRSEHAPEGELYGLATAGKPDFEATLKTANPEPWMYGSVDWPQGLAATGESSAAAPDAGQQVPTVRQSVPEPAKSSYEAPSGARPLA